MFYKPYTLRGSHILIQTPDNCYLPPKYKLMSLYTTSNIYKLCEKNSNTQEVVFEIVLCRIPN
jgi:hypothetical protein